MKKATMQAIALMCLSVVVDSVTAQSINRVQNPSGEQGLQHWRVYGNATAGVSQTGTCFVLGNDEYMLQDIPITNDNVGLFAVLIARASTEGLNADGSAAGWPSLYGYMMDHGNSTSGYVYDYLQDPSMGGRPKAGEWIKLWGIYKVPEKTGRLRLFLFSGCKKGKTPDNCTGRFRDVGIYLFSTQEEAKDFVKQY
jgi:hypothetical protein